jgi:hypothetical protein
MFHCLARECADLLIGGTSSERSKAAWRQVYRALEHGPAREKCKQKETIRKFPKEIEDFANMFVTMQEKRHEADYDPFARFAKSEVVVDIAAVEAAISKFRSVRLKHRRAFCAWVLLKNRS